MKKIVLFLMIGLYMQASSLVDVYRSEGISSVQIQLEETLQNPIYWKEYLRNKDVKYGFYEFDTPVVVVDKKAQNLKLFHNIKGKQKEKSSQNIITGKMGDKQKEGDLKTPVGVYDIERRFVPQDTFYGPVSFSLSYPNLLDTLGGKSGHGIWIHGFPMDNAKRDTQTKGCVALENDLLVKFDKDLGFDYAVVIIAENGLGQVNKNDIAKILANLYRWRYAWKISDVDAYLDFYDEDFRRFDGKNKRQFASMKRSIFSRKENKIIRFTNIAITPYPDIREKNLYRIVFNEYYKTKNYNFSGKKELYIKFKDDKMKIIAEK